MLDLKKYGNKRFLLGYLIIILFTLIVSLLSIWVFASTLVPKFKGISSAILFLIIPLLYFAGYLYLDSKIKKVYNLVNKEMQFQFDLTKQILIYIIIMLMLFFIFLITLYFPLEKRGVNQTPLNLTIQPYLLKETYTLYNESLLIQANNIYKKYNITLHLNNPINLKKDLNETERKLILTQNCTIIESLYNLTNKIDSKFVKLILINYNGSINGMGNLCGKGNLIIMSVNNTMQGWILSHELGHVFSAKVQCWKFNLMKEISNECSKANWITHDFIRGLQPDFLNQNQVNTIVESIKTRFL